MHSLKDFIAEADKHLVFLTSQLEQYTTLLQDGKKHITHLEAQRMDVILQMIEVTVPSFTTQELKKLAKLLHNGSLGTLANQYQEETEQAKKRILEIEGDKEYISRAILTNEKTGDYVVEFNQINSAFKDVDKEFAPYKKYTYEFEDLIQDKYGTDEYEHTGILRFFNNEHLENWKIGDLLCEEFGYEEFLPLLDKYLELKEKDGKLLEAANHYKQKILYIERLEKEHGSLSQKLPELPAIYRNKLAKELDMFLSSTSEQSAAVFFEAYPNLDHLLKTQQGLNFQRKYLNDFQTKLSTEKELLLAKKTRLLTENRRYKSKPYKYQNKKWTSLKFQKRFRRNHEWIQKRFDKYHNTNQVIYKFDNYKSAPSNLDDVFWWGLITNNKIDGSFSPSVKNYYESNTHDSQNYEGDNTVSPRGGNFFSTDNS